MSVTSTGQESVRSQSIRQRAASEKMTRSTPAFVGLASIRLPKESSQNHAGQKILNKTMVRKIVMETIRLHAGMEGVFTVNDVRAHVEDLNHIAVNHSDIYGACFTNAQNEGIIEAIPNKFTQTDARRGRSGVTVWRGKEKK